jgi:hypothetical protein
MKRPTIRARAGLVLAVVAITAFGLFTPKAVAAGSDLQAKVTQIKQAIAHNQQSLAQYTWQMEQTISVNGDVKDSQLFQVVLGPDGKPVKAAITQTPSPSGRQFGIRHRITEDYAAYGKQVASLAQSYAQPDPGKLQQLYAQGNVSVKSGGAPGIVSLVISNYVKQGDSVTLSFSQAQKALLGINVNTYNSGPSDVVTMAVQFAKLPDGTNHVSTATINGQSKNMVVQQQNMNYQKRGQ